MIRRLCSASIILTFFFVQGGQAQQSDSDAMLAFTFAYSPSGTAVDLASGYKKHLEWHKARNDPILWYAWFVVEGERIGHFVDGAFDVTGAEFDARPDPAGDAADAVENFLPTARMQYRRIFRLRKTLGTSSFLEERRPSPFLQVVYYRVYPGRQVRFEAAARAVARVARQAGIEYAMYEMLTGAEGPLYAMYVPLRGFGSFDEPMTSLERVAESAGLNLELTEAMQDLTVAAPSSRSEVWQYRSDLSLLPE